MTVIHPGSIQARIGAALHGIEVNTEQQDIPGIKNFTDLLEDYASVYMDPGPDGKTQLDRLPAFDWAESENENMERLRARRRHCLRVLREQNLFGYLGQPPLGDASALKVQIGQSEEALEA